MTTDPGPGAAPGVPLAGDPRTPPATALLRRLPAWARTGTDDVVAGRALLALTGAVILTTAPLLDLESSQWTPLVAVSGAMAAALLVSLVLPWSRLPAGASTAFPTACLLALLALGLTSEGVASTYVGVIALVFGYAGLFHGSRVGRLLLPLALVTYLSMFTTFTNATYVRTAVWAAFWIASSEVLVAMSAQQRTAAALLDRANRTDSLTSLENRRGLDLRLAALQPGDCLALCDLDHFKAVNDSRGHAYGDLVLERFGHAIAQFLRRRDHAARYGGEEFVLLFAQTSPEQAVTALEALRREWLTAPLPDDGAPVTFSAGVASFEGDRSVDEVLRGADTALYAAKAAGRDRFELAAWDTPSDAGSDVPPVHLREARRS
ncbi:diguanylate cyclase [Cellulomonas fimi]|uniref:GGDEF domain-containing protein n=1 Tax=Cellulomonas fimi TaxID=1708 RepID=A0A7Y0LY43_CELFI|nr:GGDEF domain-containing protein [Cellulomonas fimi]NMR20046.1 GGDEF domain-containing protein [Cellulomonas fimi]